MSAHGGVAAVLGHSRRHQVRDAPHGCEVSARVISGEKLGVADAESRFFPCIAQRRKSAGRPLCPSETPYRGLE